MKLRKNSQNGGIAKNFRGQEINNSQFHNGQVPQPNQNFNQNQNRLSAPQNYYEIPAGQPIAPINSLEPGYVLFSKNYSQVFQPSNNLVLPPIGIPVQSSDQTVNTNTNVPTPADPVKGRN